MHNSYCKCKECEFKRNKEHIDAVNRLTNQINKLTNFDKKLEECTKLRVALTLIEDDVHQFGYRPCSTCEQITKLIGRDFGCIAKQKLKQI